MVANVKLTGSYGLGTTQTIYTATADGFYRVSVYMNVGTSGTCASAPCAGEAVTIQWNDGVSTTALATANCNLVTVCGSSVMRRCGSRAGRRSAPMARATAPAQPPRAALQRLRAGGAAVVPGGNTAGNRALSRAGPHEAGPATARPHCLMARPWNGFDLLSHGWPQGPCNSRAVSRSVAPHRETVKP